MVTRTVWEDRAISVFRIILGFLFFEHGSQKLLGIPPGAPGMPPLQVGSQLWISGVIELVGGALILLGLLTRFAAFICSGEMAVAYFQAHAPHGFWPIVNKGEEAVFYCFAFLVIVFLGGGAWSLDRLFFKNSKIA